MLFSMLRKHVRLMILLLAGSLLAGLLLYVYAQPVYASRALLLLDAPDANRVQRAMREFEAPHLTERTARGLGLTGSAREIGGRLVFKQSLQAGPDGALELEVRAVSAELAARWPKALVEELTRTADNLRYRRLQEIISTYGKELREVAQKLGEPLDANFQIKGHADVERVLAVLQKSAPAELVRVGKRLDEIGQARLSVIDPSLDLLAKLALLTPIDTTAQPADPPSWHALREEQQRLSEELTAAEREVPPGEERLSALRSQLADLGAKLAAEYAEMRARIDLEYQALLERKTELEEKVPNPDSAGDPGSEVRQRAALSAMSRTQWPEMAAEMQRKIEALQNDPDAAVPRVRFGGLTEFRERPLAPDRVRIGRAALTAGLALAVLVPLLIELLGRASSGTRCAEAKLGLSPLGTVPSLHAGVDAVRESMEKIRETLFTTGAPRVVMITSALPGEGKTITAMELAIACAAAGSKTLLLDGDLADGSVHRLFGYRRAPGLSDVLLGEAARDAACRPAPQDNLSIFSAGRRVEDPGELLGSERFTAVMTALREEFACVLVDAPAVLGLSSTSILQRQVDGVLLVIRSGTARGKLEAAHETLRVNGASFFGFVENAGPRAGDARPQLQPV